MLSAIRYIHQNPVKAGICKKIEDYKYSSYKEYIKTASLVDSEFVLSMMSKSEFEKYNNAESDDKFLDIDSKSKIRLTDEQAKMIIKECSNCENVWGFQKLNFDEQSKFVVLFYENGMSIRQISRLTGITKGVVEKWLK